MPGPVPTLTGPDRDKPDTPAAAVDSSVTHVNERIKTAIALHEAGEPQKSLEIYESILKQFPGHPDALFLSGLVYRDAGDRRRAIHLISRAITIDPRRARFHCVLGLLLRANGNDRAALERFREALRLDDGDASCFFYLGDLCMDLGRSAEASARFQAAVNLAPEMTAAWINLGLCHKTEKKLVLARDCFERAIALEPENIDAHVNLGLTLLLMDRYVDGWREYDWRLRHAANGPARFGVPANLPQWDGRADLHGKKIVILAEQGFGDTLQFVRYLPQLKKRGAAITMVCPKPLRSLLGGLAIIDEFLDAGNAIRADCHCPLVSLPGLFGTTADTIPDTSPYLHASPERRRFWSEKLGPARRPRVGLVWEGKPLHQNDPLRCRSCRLADFSPLTGLEGIDFFSLQKGEPVAQLQELPAPVRITDLNDDLTDFGETAAVMAHLDLIITIDTAAAHLAGALGRPVWTLLPFAPDWRWSLDRETCPWYRSMTLFRQTAPDRWAEPIERMAVGLHTLRANWRPPEMT